MDFVDDKEVEDAIRTNRSPWELSKAAPVTSPFKGRERAIGLSNAGSNFPSNTFNRLNQKPPPASPQKSKITNIFVLNNWVAEKEEEPGNILDKLFKKTSAKPMIYYLPLTEEQVKEKDSKEKEEKKKEENSQTLSKEVERGKHELKERTTEAPVARTSSLDKTKKN